MKVLIVEDSKEISRFLKNGLEAENFAADVAGDGELGSYLARTGDYGMILLDNGLPKKTGLEVCREVRGAGKHMPIIMISVMSDTPTKVELLNAGADDYLPKPFSFEELLARMRALIRRPRQIEAEEEVLKIDDLILNTKTAGVTRGGKEIDLHKKEYMLLEYLLKNKGVTLSRGMILEHVWDMSADPFSNTIESHISSLRRKVDAGGRRKLIRTVPGRGYTIAL